MRKFTDTILNADGRPVRGALVKVTDYVTGVAPTLYADDEVTPLPVPLFTDSRGGLSFNVASGVYDITISNAGDTVIVRKVQLDGGGSVVAGPGIDVTFAAGAYTVGLHTALSASMSGGSDVEIGSSIASVVLSWSYNTSITAQSLSGSGTSAPLLAARTQTVSGPFTTLQTWGLSADNGADHATGSTTLRFLSKRYWGVSALTTLTDAQIIALANSVLTTTRVMFDTLAPSAQYIYFAWPTSFGTPTFLVNGLLNTAWTKVRSASAFVNASGASVNYDVWRSDNLLTSTFQVTVQ